MPAVSCGHPDDTIDTNCTHGQGPGCAAAAGRMTAEWLVLGGRGIDTANAYRNQPQVGAAIRAAIANGTVSRHEIFVTTKINPGGRTGTGKCSKEAALAAVKDDMEQLAIGKLDLVLQHFPCASDEGNQEVWRGLVQARDLGYTVRIMYIARYSDRVTCLLRSATGRRFCFCLLLQLSARMWFVDMHAACDRSEPLQSISSRGHHVYQPWPASCEPVRDVHW
jgi:aryl-alcohol dehydrogenase-like predicted oxidoreductase